MNKPRTAVTKSKLIPFIFLPLLICFFWWVVHLEVAHDRLSNPLDYRIVVSTDGRWGFETKSFFFGWDRAGTTYLTEAEARFAAKKELEYWKAVKDAEIADKQTKWTVVK